jgi:NADPH-dependent 2,4-dienoyl-CoA reductase/sulfur reductase-like enzyme
MERVLGPEMGDFVRALHEEHGVIFHLGDTVSRSTASARRSRAAACWRPTRGRRRRRAAAPGLAEQAGLTIDRGVAVNGSSKPASPESTPAATSRAGPIRTPGKHPVEHWVVAERQGQTAARNMLGQQQSLRRGAVLLEPALRCAGQ